MEPLSNINKGKRLEKFICQAIEQAGLGSARREAGSGSGLKKGDIFSGLPFLIEAKNVPTASIESFLKWIDQSKSQAEKGNWAREKWALVFRDPRTPEFQDLYAVVDFWQFLTLLKTAREPLIKEPDQEIKWHLTNLKNAINRVIKDLE